MATARREIERARVVTAREVGAAQASIFDAHLSLLADAEMLADVKARLATGLGAAAAWSGCLAEVEAQWAGLPDPYLRERAADVRAVGEQVLRALTGQTARRMTAAGVLVADDLTPAETAGLDLDLVTGVVLAQGSPTSHAAILARARDIPVIVSAGRDVLDLAEGTTVVVDGSTGELHVAPSADVVEEYQQRAREAAERNARQLALAEQPAISRDGTAFSVAANLGSVADARAALVAGADGAGLVRTEFVFLDRLAAPSVEEQRAVYDEIAEAMGGRRVTLRTLDVGGDKPLSYLPMPVEANPFLGQRGIRLSLEHRDLLRDQLAAMCETARRFPISIMFPMLTTPGELIEARQVLTEAAGPSGLPEGLRVGTMIEVPAAALKIEAFLPYVDFVSIGTNDLTQYAMAAERGNGAVAALSDPLDPGVLRLIDHVCRAARGRIDVAVCGEAASDELAVPVLAGLGVHELSVSPAAVPRVKAAVRQLEVERCSTCRGSGPGARRCGRRAQARAGVVRRESWLITNPAGRAYPSSVGQLQFDARGSDSPWIDTVWTCTSEHVAEMTAVAAVSWGLVFFEREGRTHACLTGPETRTGAAPVPEDATFVGIEFDVGTSLRALPTPTLVDGGLELPDATRRTFRLDGVRWETPRRR